jgi:hypothetical protein
MTDAEQRLTELESLAADLLTRTERLEKVPHVLARQVERLAADIRKALR